MLSIDHWPRHLALLLTGLVLEALFGNLPAVRRLVQRATVARAAIRAQVIAAIADPKLPRWLRLTATGLVPVCALIVGVKAGLLLNAAIAATPWGSALAIGIVAATVDSRRTLSMAQAARAALAQDSTNAAGSDPHGIARTAIENLAKRWIDTLVAPVMWSVVAGLPGLLGLAAVTAIDGAADGRRAGRVARVLTTIPALLGAVMLCLAAIAIPTARPVPAFLGMLRREARTYRGAPAGYAVAALAGALGLALAGPRRYFEAVIVEPWIGDGRARAVPGDVRRAQAVYLAACTLLVATLALGLGVAVLPQSLPYSAVVQHLNHESHSNRSK